MNDLLYVPTPQSTLNPKTDPFLPGVQRASVWDDATGFIKDDVILPTVGIGTGTIDAVVGSIDPLLGSVGGVLNTTVGTVSDSIGGVTDAAGGLLGSPLLLIGGAIAIVIVIAVVAK